MVVSHRVDRSFMVEMVLAKRVVTNNMLPIFNSVSLLIHVSIEQCLLFVGSEFEPLIC